MPPSSNVASEPIHLAREAQRASDELANALHHDDVPITDPTALLTALGGIGRALETSVTALAEAAVGAGHCQGAAALREALGHQRRAVRALAHAVAVVETPAGSSVRRRRPIGPGSGANWRSSSSTSSTST
ncbi:hypothetical protein [Plantactinospora sp. CA-290183]|uniref:hypothetical protein n=1 Tax=Plantactinospora sp. CA-290183 TaxID=3240006 RepID=UPI003D950280